VDRPPQTRGSSSRSIGVRSTSAILAQFGPVPPYPTPSSESRRYTKAASPCGLVLRNSCVGGVSFVGLTGGIGQCMSLGWMLGAVLGERLSAEVERLGPGGSIVQTYWRQTVALLGPLVLGALFAASWDLFFPWPHQHDLRLAIALALGGGVVAIAALPMWEWAKRAAADSEEAGERRDPARPAVQGKAVVAVAEADAIGVAADHVPAGGISGEARARQVRSGGRVIGVSLQRRPPEKD
jgi:hypothetical protein